jgi:hypothetical protein
VAAAIAAIDQAKLPPDAVAAYARGLAVDRTDARLYRAYVHKLVEFDLPDMAVPPAQALLSLQPDDALALAVTSIDAAKHGDMRTAVTDVAIAATHAPDDAFVQHAAGQVVAWYDTTPDHSVVPASIVSTLDAVRPQLQAKQPYADAYKQATEAYQQAAAAAKANAAAAAGPKPDPAQMHDLTVAPSPLPAAPPAPAAAQAPPPVVNNYYTTPQAAAPATVVTPTYVYPQTYYAPPPTVVYPYPTYYCGPWAPPFVSLSFGFGFGGHGGFHHR